MKRIAALTGLTVTALAIPATAMAGTGHSASGPGNQGVIGVACPVPRPLPAGPVKVRVPPGQRVPIGRGLIKPVPTRVVCPVKAPRPGPQPCLSGTLTFDMPSWSSRVTEVSGPRLFVGQQAIYRGTAYTITSVSGDTFTADHDGTPVVNRGAAITNATAYMLCGSGQGK